MKLSPKKKPRVVNYVSPEELGKLQKRALADGLRTPSQIVGVWLRLKLAEK